MQRKKHRAEFKAKIAFEAAKGIKTLGQLASEFKIHPTQITTWKKTLMTQMPELFKSSGQHQKEDDGVTKAELYEQIGRMRVELDWLKKKSDEAIS